MVLTYKNGTIEDVEYINGVKQEILELVAANKLTSIKLGRDNYPSPNYDMDGI